MSKIASTPTPPYYAVIFTSVRTDGDNGYIETAKQVLDLHAHSPVFLAMKRHDRILAFPFHIGHL